MVMIGPMLLLAVPATLFGFLSIQATGEGGIGTFLFFDKVHDFEPNPGLLAGSAVLAAAAFVLCWRIYMSRRLDLAGWKARLAWPIRVWENKYYLDDLYQWGIDRLVLVFASFIAFFDRVVVNDVGVNGPGNSVRRTGFILRYHVSGRLYNYALGMAVGAVAIAVVLWALAS